MNRSDLLLAILASASGRSYTPVQIQKAVFLVCRNASHLVDSGPSFNFAPYDYGPFDSDIYSEASALHSVGEAVIAPSGVGNWNTYAASDAGIAKAERIFSSLDENTKDYIRRVSEWVRAQTFSSLVKSIYDAYPDMKVNSVFRG